MSESIPKQDTKSAVKFLAYTLFGIFVFFVKIPINGTTSIPIDHLINLMKYLLTPYYTYIIFALSFFSTIYRLVKKKLKTPTDIIIYIFATIGCIMSFCIMLNIGPAFLFADGVGLSAIVATGNILCAIFLASLFVPFLTDFGGVDAFGVLFRPIMRKVFKTPGTSAVIGVSAFLGNYSIGHVMARKMYDEGKFTEQEAVIVATGFSTCSIGLMINLANMLDLMQYWNIYVLCVAFVNFAITAIITRIPPISRHKTEYKPGVEPQPEQPAPVSNMLRQFWAVGVDRASKAPNLFTCIARILKSVTPIICEVTGSCTFFVITGTVIVAHSHVFQYLGMLFFPFLKLIGIPAADMRVVQEGLGIIIMEPVLAGVIGTGKGLGITSTLVLGIVAYTSQFFFSGFVTSLRSAKIDIPIWEMLVMWVERVIVGILLVGCIALLF